MNTMPLHQGDPEFSEERAFPFPSESPILNDELLAQYEAMDEGLTEDQLLPKLVGIFQNNFPDHLAKLDHGLQTQDPSEVVYVIHKMLGMSHNVGALRLSKILVVLENSETEAKMELGQDVVTMLNQEYKAAAEALVDYLKPRAQ